LDAFRVAAAKGQTVDGGEDGPPELTHRLDRPIEIGPLLQHCSFVIS